MAAAKKKSNKRSATKKTASANRNTPGSKSQKKVTKSGSRSKAKKQPKAESKPASTVVKMPTNMSLRSLSKAQMIRRLLDDDVAVVVQKIAYTSAACFILIGVALVGQQTLFSAPHLLTAQLNTAAGERHFGSADLSTDITEPEVLSHSSIPSKLTEERLLKVSTKGAADHSLTIKGIDNDTKEVISNGQMTTQIILGNIPVNRLPVGSYSVEIALTSKDGTKYVETLGKFVIPETADEKEDSDQAEIEYINVSDVYTEFTTNDTQASPEAVTMTRKETEHEDVTFNISIPVSEVRGKTPLNIQAPLHMRSLELYIQPSNSVNKRFIGMPEQYLNEWHYTLDPTDIPNGDYQLSAQGIVDGLIVYSEPVKLHIDHLERVERKVSEEVKEYSETREFMDISMVDTGNSEKDRSTLTQASPETEAALNQHKSDIQKLVRNFSLANQTGDPLALEVAKRALEDKKEEIKREFDNLDKNAVEEAFADYEERAEKFESLRRERSQGVTSSDADSDGISDTDERMLFGTDPSSADTDGDGVTDGIEILKSYDPTDPSSQATLTYESPKESVALVRDDILSVKEVRPVIRKTESDEEVRVQAEITGQALPNSFVTLYIFSTPTIVTVKTEDDGSFTYTFDKELEDGAHEVYVAVTDNSGEIVAQSNPFSFVKEAEAFTVASAASEQNFTGSPSPVGNPYSLAVGLGILAFGFILVLLGMAIKPGQDNLPAQSA